MVGVELVSGDNNTALRTVLNVVRGLRGMIHIFIIVGSFVRSFFSISFLYAVFILFFLSGLLKYRGVESASITRRYLVADVVECSASVVLFSSILSVRCCSRELFDEVQVCASIIVRTVKFSLFAGYVHSILSCRILRVLCYGGTSKRLLV